MIFHDVRSGDLPEGISEETALADVHALDQGMLYRGGDVVPRILRLYPGWRGLSAVLSVRPFIWFVRLVYRILARHRWFFRHFI